MTKQLEIKIKRFGKGFTVFVQRSFWDYKRYATGNLGEVEKVVHEEIEASFRKV